jgi:hypothetical protein
MEAVPVDSWRVAGGRRLPSFFNRPVWIAVTKRRVRDHSISAATATHGLGLNRRRQVAAGIERPF